MLRERHALQADDVEWLELEVSERHTALSRPQPNSGLEGEFSFQYCAAVALTQGTTNLMVAPRGTTRLPDLNQLDMTFRKIFRSGARTVQPRLDIYNLMNSATIINRVTTLGSSYGAVGGIQRGRLIKLGMNVDF